MTKNWDAEDEVRQVDTSTSHITPNPTVTFESEPYPILVSKEQKKALEADPFCPDFKVNDFKVNYEGEKW
jgi:hypothetical protein